MFFSDNFSKPHPTAQSIVKLTFVANLATCARPTGAPAKADLRRPQARATTPRANTMVMDRRSTRNTRRNGTLARAIRSPITTTSIRSAAAAHTLRQAAHTWHMRGRLFGLPLL